jgi:hypothetical protein
MYSSNVYPSHRYLVSSSPGRQHYTSNFLYIPYILLVWPCYYIRVISYVNEVLGHWREQLFHWMPPLRFGSSSSWRFIVHLGRLSDIRTTTLGLHYYSHTGPRPVRLSIPRRGRPSFCSCEWPGLGTVMNFHRIENCVIINDRSWEQTPPVIRWARNANSLTEDKNLI